jgi:hypothetical protein
VLPSAFRFQPGDLVACYGTDWISRGIQLLTWSPFTARELRRGPSHLAIITESDRGLLWVESTTLCRHPCVVRGERVAGCQAHDPEQRIQDYLHAGGSVSVYRLTGINQLDESERQLLRRILFQHFLWTPVGYDLGGAILSGARAIRWLGLLPGADLQSLFCSELVAAILMRLNRLNHANPTGFTPARLLRTLVVAGKYFRTAQWSAQPSVKAACHE